MRHCRRLNSRGDDAGAFRLAETQLESTNDPIWRSLLINAALRLGDLATARRELEAFEPALLTSFDASSIQPEAALFGAELLLREGRTREATQLLESLLVRYEPPEQGYDPVADKLIRAKALGFLGRDEAALDELRAAYLQGYRLLWDFDYFQRLDGAAAFAALRDDVRFRAIVAEIEADNRAMRERARAAEAAS
jgi:ATP/maltotriose-dependent transcriptional regulator MalT